MRCYCLLLASFLFCGSVLAAQPIGYQVEVIAFLHQDAKQLSHWQPAKQQDARLKSDEITELAEKFWVLKEQEKRLANNNQYTILAHKAWLLSEQDFSKPLHFALTGYVDDDSNPMQFNDQLILEKKHYWQLTSKLNNFWPSDNGLLEHQHEQVRNFRSKELHHLDDPTVGILVTIIPLDETQYKQRQPQLALTVN